MRVLVGVGEIAVGVFVTGLMAVAVGEPTVGTSVFVAIGVFVVFEGEDGVRVSMMAPGVRNTLSQDGCVRMEGSSGS